MQALIPSIDHESRETSYQGDNDTTSSEGTPLLYYRFPAYNHRNNLTTIFVVGCLMFVLLSGFTIGVYLLILQSSTDNVVPPRGETLHVVYRSEWDKSYKSSKPPLAIVNVPIFKADCVVIHQTDSRTCEYNEDCIQVIRELTAAAIEEPLPFNFLIASDGYVYEYLGLNPTAYVPNRAALVLGFIGNFTHVPPTKEQIIAAKTVIDKCVETDHLDPNYTLIGSNKDELKYLVDNPANLVNEVDRLMFVILTSMYSNLTEAMEHM